MYRSKRADKNYLRSWLKIAAAYLLFVAVGCGAVVGYYLVVENGDEVPVFAEEVITYEEEPGEPAVFVEIFEEPVYVEYDGENYGEYEEEYEEEYEYLPEDCEPENLKIIALTFDDGPGYFTDYLLDILDIYGGRVTFAVIGNLVEDGADTVVRAFESGHEIVGHSWDHRDLARLPVDAIVEQITQTSAIIDAATGEPPPRIFRAPFGHFNRRIEQAAYEAGYGVLNWSIDPRDWYYRCEYHVHDYIIENARHGAIIVLHDVHETTVIAMERTIPELMDMGFELVTSSEVIYYVYGGIEAGVEYTGIRRRQQR